MDNRFKSRAVSRIQANKIDFAQDAFQDLYETLCLVIPEGREKSLYITKLEEACMWATKAISREEQTETNDEETKEEE